MTITAQGISKRALAEHLDKCMTGIQVLSKAVAQDFTTVGDRFQMQAEIIADLAARIDRLERFALTIVRDQDEAPDA